MGVKDAASLSIGEWTAVCRAWRKAHGGDKPAPPTEAEFDLAMMMARGTG